MMKKKVINKEKSLDHSCFEIIWFKKELKITEHISIFKFILISFLINLEKLILF